MKLTLHNTLETLYAAGLSPYIDEALPAGTAKAKLEATVSTGYTDKTKPVEWDDLRNLLDDYPAFWKELSNKFAPAVTWDALTENLTGTVSITLGTAAVVGIGTLFTSQLKVGNEITISGESFFVLTIADDLNLTIAANHVAGASTVTATTDKQKQVCVKHRVWKAGLTDADLDKLRSSDDRKSDLENCFEALGGRIEACADQSDLLGGSSRVMDDIPINANFLRVGVTLYEPMGHILIDLDKDGPRTVNLRGDGATSLNYEYTCKASWVKATKTLIIDTCEFIDLSDAGAHPSSLRNGYSNYRGTSFHYE